MSFETLGTSSCSSMGLAEFPTGGVVLLVSLVMACGSQAEVSKGEQVEDRIKVDGAEETDAGVSDALARGDPNDAQQQDVNLTDWADHELTDSGKSHSEALNDRADSPAEVSGEDSNEALRTCPPFTMLGEAGSRILSMKVSGESTGGTAVDLDDNPGSCSPNPECTDGTHNSLGAFLAESGGLEGLNSDLNELLGSSEAGFALWLEHSLWDPPGFVAGGTVLPWDSCESAPPGQTSCCPYVLEQSAVCCATGWPHFMVHVSLETESHLVCGGVEHHVHYPVKKADEELWSVDLWSVHMELSKTTCEPGTCFESAIVGFAILPKSLQNLICVLGQGGSVGPFCCDCGLEDLEPYLDVDIDGDGLGDAISVGLVIESFACVELIDVK